MISVWPLLSPRTAGHAARETRRHSRPLRPRMGRPPGRAPRSNCLAGGLPEVYARRSGCRQGRGGAGFARSASVPGARDGRAPVQLAALRAAGISGPRAAGKDAVVCPGRGRSAHSRGPVCIGRTTAQFALAASCPSGDALARCRKRREGMATSLPVSRSCSGGAGPGETLGRNRRPTPPPGRARGKPHRPGGSGVRYGRDSDAPIPRRLRPSESLRHPALPGDAGHPPKEKRR